MDLTESQNFEIHNTEITYLKGVGPKRGAALKKHGITKIESLEKKFDPNLHQAMMEIENNDLDEGIVVQEIQTGYMIHDRLLRPAMVGVSKKPQKTAEAEPDKELKSDNEENEKDTKN